MGRLVEVAVALPDWAARVLEEAAEELGVEVSDLLREALEVLVGLSGLAPPITPACAGV